jgi:hypothetical protein
MSRYLALDPYTGDLILKSGGGVERVDEGRFVIQQVQCKLKTWLGEWQLDPTIGWVSPADFEKNYSLPEIERRARVIILQTQGVKTITDFSTSYSQRKLTIWFRAMTIYGEIETTVPWSMT